MKSLLIICLAMSISIASFSQTSRENIYTMAAGTSNYDYDQLTDFVESKLAEKENIALFFYYWIAMHIEYDDKVTLYDIGHSKTAAESIQNESVLKSRKTTCMGFTNLYDSFLEYFGIEHRLVIGYSKNSISALKGIKPQVDHAWSAIRLNGKWHLVEPTWANQLIEDPKTRDTISKLTLPK